jgi:protein prenyltransferase alpha subunit repeat containing protein 1
VCSIPVASLSSSDHLISQSIEILPGDGVDIRATLPAGALTYAPCILVDGHLGVPQKPLYGVYLDAVNRFTAARHASSIASAAMLTSSAVILLANPAHATALNARKRLLVQKILDGSHELKFIGLLLAGVKDAAKQDGLWHHRRWLLRRMYPAVDPSLCFSTPPAALWTNELDLINQACEIYPRNYHAWTHRTLCMQAAASSANSLPIVRGDIEFTSQWIERHISDASAAHHLCTLIVYVARHSSDSRHQELTGGSSRAITHALGLVRAYPEHEALWTYLRATLALLPAKETTVVRRDTLSALSQDNLTSDSLTKRNFELFLEWNSRTVTGQRVPALDKDAA